MATSVPSPTQNPVGFPAGTVLGYPRIGRRRELKKAVEAFWAGKTSAEELEATARELRLATVRRLVDLGLGDDDASVPGSFSFYDQVLDVAASLGAVPSRFASLTDDAGRLANVGKAPKMTPMDDPTAPFIEPSLGNQAAAHRAGRNGQPAPETPANSASLFRTGAGAFFRDQRASRVGDIVTIRINIQDKAVVGNSTSRSRAARTSCWRSLSTSRASRSPVTRSAARMVWGMAATSASSSPKPSWPSSSNS